MTILDGYKKFIAAGGGVAGVSFDAVPEKALPYYTAIVVALVVGFAIQDFAKAYKGGK